MTNKIQELTDKLYNEGLSKGQQEGAELLQKAEKESARIIENAHIEASKIIEKAQKSAEEMQAKVLADTKLAAIQSMNATRQEMEKMILSTIVTDKVSEILSDTLFLKEMIADIVKSFNPNRVESIALELILPDSMQNQLDSFIKKEVGEILKTDISISFSKKIKSGFSISPKNGGYLLHFTDEEFDNLISSYMRPATRKILFGL